MARRLKVFQAQFGFWDSVVAAPSQAAALRAWGTRQNLFAAGQARDVTDPGAVAAALAHPETPLRRAVGSSDPFSLEPRLPEAPRGRASSRAPAKPKLVRAAAAPPDRSAVDAAEATLRRLAEERGQDEAAFQRRRADLDSQEAVARRLYESARSRAENELARCRKAFIKAGGRLDD